MWKNGKKKTIWFVYSYKLELRSFKLLLLRRRPLQNVSLTLPRKAFHLFFGRLELYSMLNWACHVHRFMLFLGLKQYSKCGNCFTCSSFTFKDWSSNGESLLWIWLQSKCNHVWVCCIVTSFVNIGSNCQTFYIQNLCHCHWPKAC